MGILAVSQCHLSGWDKKELMLAIHSKVHAFSHVIMLCYLATSSALCKWQRLFITPTLKGASVKRRFRGPCSCNSSSYPSIPPKSWTPYPEVLKHNTEAWGSVVFHKKCPKGPATYLFISLKDGPEGSNLFSLGAEKWLELQHFFQEAFSIPLCLYAAAQPWIRHRAPLTTEVHCHLREQRQYMVLMMSKNQINQLKNVYSSSS